MPSLLAVPDKFKGTAGAAELASAIATGAAAAGWGAVALPMSDGGEGLLDAMGGANRSSVVTGPHGRPVTAAWRLDAEPSDGGAAPLAVIEMSQAAGLVLAGGGERNDAVAATTRGVGELVVAAVAAGARRLVVGCGGSATTDGGAGALSVLGGPKGLGGAQLVVACDTRIGFVAAARGFGPQKGASPAEVALLEARLGELAERYVTEFGRDVRHLAGAGAAGGLAGGLAAIGGTLVSGFDLVASLVALEAHVLAADALVTGEGRLDELSFEGKVVSGVAARRLGRPTLCVVGSATAAGLRLATAGGLDVADLSERFGGAAALARPCELVSGVVADWLAELTAPRRSPTVAPDAGPLPGRTGQFFRPAH